MATSLLDWIVDLLRDSDAREAFFEDPERFADDNGFRELSAADVHESLLLAADDGFPSPRHFGDDHDGVHHLRSYLDDNRVFIDNRDNDLDNSVHQDIDTGGGHHRHHDHDDHHDFDRDFHGDFNHDFNRGGDFEQTIDNDTVIASGDGAVAAADDIRDSTITSGDGSVVGDDNETVSGDDNTTAFGRGDATSSDFDGARFGDGAAVSIGGNSRGTSEDDDTSTSVRGGDGSTAVNVAGDDSNSFQATDQSETDISRHLDVDDHSDTNTHTDFRSHNDTDIDDTSINTL